MSVRVLTSTEGKPTEGMPVDSGGQAQDTHDVGNHDHLLDPGRTKWQRIFKFKLRLQNFLKKMSLG
jgi:hypothetical protein